MIYKFYLLVLLACVLAQAAYASQAEGDDAAATLEHALPPRSFQPRGHSSKPSKSTNKKPSKGSSKKSSKGNGKKPSNGYGNLPSKGDNKQPSRGKPSYPTPPPYGGGSKPTTTKASSIKTTTAKASSTKATSTKASSTKATSTTATSSQAAPLSTACGAAGNRQCWSSGFDINTDYSSKTPSGTTRTYNFILTSVPNYTGADGVAKPALLINGQFPGPTIYGDWGDTIQVNVQNNLKDNGTSIHWHGVWQLDTNDQDGTNGLTQCPIPPGSSMTYTFKMHQYGSGWWHSHTASLYADGIVGAIHVNGPTSANYDIDLGPFTITDWYYDTSTHLALKAQQLRNGPPPVSDNILFNGTNVNGNGGGQYSRTTLQPGKKHKLSIINTSVENEMTVSLVGHNFTVVATDFVPVKPIVKNTLFLSIGQRYDVIIEADQKVDNYWFKATLAASGLCGQTKAVQPAAVFSYQGAPANKLPSNAGPTITAGCNDETGFVPVVPVNAPSSGFNPKGHVLDVTLETPTVAGAQVFKWDVNGSAIDIQWDKPILEYLHQGQQNWPRQANVIEVPDANAWTYWIIQNVGPIPHPMHLHGHDFLILGQGPGTFDVNNGAGTLNFNNPTRIDTAMLPASGYLVIAFSTANPGAHLFHCHIAWHISQGLGVQFLERISEVVSQTDFSQMDSICSAWSSYAKTAPYKQLDSGL